MQTKIVRYFVFGNVLMLLMNVSLPCGAAPTPELASDLQLLGNALELGISQDLTEYFKNKQSLAFIFPFYSQSSSATAAKVSEDIHQDNIKLSSS